MKGIIIKLISNDYTVLANQKKIVCKSRGKFRNQKISPLVGDHVIFDEENQYILDVEPRKNSLVRPPISNIDQAVIITSAKDPDFSSHLLDKLITIIEFNNIEPIICFTKLDLLGKEQLEKIKIIMNYYRFIGYKVYQNDDIDNLSTVFKDKITVFTGQSGAGKSTLLNHLDNTLDLKTNDISYSLGRGKHTTRHVELLPILNGWIADTPGFSKVDFYDMKKEDIRDQFIEFNEYRDECKYKDCMHIHEDQCEIKNKVKEGIILSSRYENYINFIEKG